MLNNLLVLKRVLAILIILIIAVACNKQKTVDRRIEGTWRVVDQQGYSTLEDSIVETYTFFEADEDFIGRGVREYKTPFPSSPFDASHYFEYFNYSIDEAGEELIVTFSGTATVGSTSVPCNDYCDRAFQLEYLKKKKLKFTEVYPDGYDYWKELERESEEE